MNSVKAECYLESLGWKRKPSRQIDWFEHDRSAVAVCIPHLQFRDGLTRRLEFLEALCKFQDKPAEEVLNNIETEQYED